MRPFLKLFLIKWKVLKIKDKIRYLDTNNNRKDNSA